MPPEVEIHPYMYGMIAFYVYYVFINVNDIKSNTDFLRHVITGSVLAFVWPISALMIAFDKIVKR